MPREPKVPHITHVTTCIALALLFFLLPASTLAAEQPESDINAAPGIGTGGPVTFTSSVQGPGVELTGVSFDVTSDAGSSPVPLLDSMRIASVNATGPFATGTSTLEMTGEGADIVVHTSRGLGLQVDSHVPANRVDIRLASGVDAHREGNTIHLQAEGFQGQLIFPDEDIELDGRSLSFDLEENERFYLRASPWAVGEDLNQDLFQLGIFRGIAQGIVAAEIFVTDEAGTITSAPIRYLDVDIVTTRAEVGRLDFTVNSELPTGKVIGINVDTPTLLDTLEGEDLSFRFDGAEMVRADSIGNLLAADGDEAQYFPIFYHGLTLLVYIPHFSEHVISIIEVTPTTVTFVATLISLTAAVGMIAVATAVILRRND